LEQFRLRAADPLLRLAELSRRQIEQSEATHGEVVLEVVEARKREAAESLANGSETEPS
jgi:hypothetical protein